MTRSKDVTGGGHRNDGMAERGMEVKRWILNMTILQMKKNKYYSIY